MHGSAGTGGTCGAANSALIEQHERAFALDALKRDVRCIWQSMFALSIYLRASHRFQDRLLKAIPQPFGSTRIVAEMGRGDFGGFSQRNDRGNILRPSAACAFLATAKPRREARPFMDVKGSHTFRTMEFVSREGEELHSELSNVERELAELPAPHLRARQPSVHS